LKHLDDWNARRTALARQYIAGLATSALVLPHVPEWAEPAWHLFVVRSNQRDALQQHLTDSGIGSLIHYPIPPHKQQAYASAPWPLGAFPLASAMADELLSLPMGPHLAAADAAAVIDGLLHAPA
jgi:dTDP-4-amino-4,6-dideoxygalactose transaminase